MPSLLFGHGESVPGIPGFPPDFFRIGKRSGRSSRCGDLEETMKTAGRFGNGFPTAPGL